MQYGEMALLAGGAALLIGLVVLVVVIVRRETSSGSLMPLGPPNSIMPFDVAPTMTVSTLANKINGYETHDDYTHTFKLLAIGDKGANKTFLIKPAKGAFNVYVNPKSIADPGHAHPYKDLDKFEAWLELTVNQSKVVYVMATPALTLSSMARLVLDS